MWDARGLLGGKFLAVVFSLIVLAQGPIAAAQQTMGLDGRPVDPFKVAAGRVAVFVFVRTDCPVSSRYAPLIQRLQASNPRVYFGLVYPAASDTPEVIAENLKQFGYRIDALRDPKLGLVKLAHVGVTPEAAVFDAHGGLIYHGAIDNSYVDFGRARPVATVHYLADAIAAASHGREPEVKSSRAVGCYIADLQ
jgi:hypothetical protein